jgi:hypothetical protein
MAIQLLGQLLLDNGESSHLYLDVELYRAQQGQRRTDMMVRTKLRSSEPSRAAQALHIVKIEYSD